MSNRDNTGYATLVSGVVAGAIAGAGLGRVVGGPNGAWIGALAGAGAAGLSGYLMDRRSTGEPDRLFRWLVVVAAVGCGLMAGFFFGFSALIMRSLALQPPAAGMAVMQTINVAVFNAWFGVAFVSAPAACVLALILALRRRPDASGRYVMAGTVCYIAGTLLVTALFNVPRNDALAAVTPTAAVAPDLWASYLREWTLWNHVRTAGALVASTLLTMALVREPRQP
jgi:uncharacterized membrane protein